MYGEKTFGEIDKDNFGLIELNCSERAGLVWVMLTPNVDFNIDDWLGDFALELETLNLNDWHIFDQRELEGPGWKVALDGYLEAYHHNQLHGEQSCGRILLALFLRAALAFFILVRIESTSFNSSSSKISLKVFISRLYLLYRRIYHL